MMQLIKNRLFDDVADKIITLRKDSPLDIYLVSSDNRVQSTFPLADFHINYKTHINRESRQLAAVEHK